MRLRRFKPHEIRAIRRLLHSGETGVKVAKAFRTSPQHVSLIKVRRLHATVPDDSPYGRRNWHPVELLPTAEEVDDYYTEQEAQQAERIRRSELTPVQRQAEDAERIRRLKLTPVQRQAEDAERIRRSELTPVQRQAEDAERIRRSELTPVQREVEDAERRSQSEVSKAPPALSVTHLVDGNGLGRCGVQGGPSKNHATTEEEFTRLAKLGVARRAELGVELCLKCVNVTVSRPPPHAR